MYAATGSWPSSLSDSQFKSYATSAYTYAEDGTLLKKRGAGCCGSNGGGTQYTFGTSEADTDTDDRSLYLAERIENQRAGASYDGEGEQATIRFNADGRTLYKSREAYVTGSGGTAVAQTSYSSITYRSDGLPEKEYMPSVIDASQVSSTDFDDTTGVVDTTNWFKANAGAIRHTLYYDDPPTGAGAGLSLSFKDGNQDARRVIETDSVIDVSWGVASPVGDTALIPATGYEAVWRGVIKPVHTTGVEHYVFTVTATGGASGTSYILNIGGTSLTGTGGESSDPIELDTGEFYKISLKYDRGTSGSSVVKLEWKSYTDVSDPDPANWTAGTQALATVPAANLYSDQYNSKLVREECIQSVGTNSTVEPTVRYEYLGGSHADLVSKVTRFAGDGATGDEVTVYEYPEGFYGGNDAYQPVQKVTKVLASTGPDVYMVSRERYDDEGKVEFRKDPSGSVTFYQYETSGLEKDKIKIEIRDVNTGALPTVTGLNFPTTVPSDFATTSGLNLVTEYTYNAEGEQECVVRPEGEVFSFEKTYGGQPQDGTTTSFDGDDYEYLIEDRTYRMVSDLGSSQVYMVESRWHLDEGPVLSRQTAKITLAADPTGNETINNSEMLTRVDRIYNAGGEVTETRTWTGNLSRTGSPGVSDYLSDEASYTDSDLASRADGEARKTFYTDNVESIAGDYNQAVFERRVYPHDADSGPVQVVWEDIEGRTIRSCTAVLTSGTDWAGNTPTGTEALSEVNRTTNHYDSRGRLSEVRSYHSLDGLDMDDEGTEGTHYTTTRYLAYDQQDRPLRTQTSDGTITATVYDRAGRAIEQWQGTDDTGATRTDPGAGSSDLEKVSEREYDHLTGLMNKLITLKATGDTETYREILYEYDQLRRQIGVKPEGEPWQHRELDTAGRVTETVTYRSSGSPTTVTDVLAKSAVEYDVAGRVAMQKNFIADGTNTKYLETKLDYDTAGRTIRVTQPDGTINKTSYDTVGRVARQCVCSSEGSDPDPATAVGDTVQRETVYQYDKANNVTVTTTYQRTKDAGTYTGLLSADPTKAKVTNNATWYDEANRPVRRARY